MQKELKYLIINYSAKDLEYIDELLEYVDNASEKIVKWFGFKDFGAKPVVTIFGGTKEFYQAILDYKPEEKIYDWISGYAFKKDGINIIYTLSVEGLLQTAHKNANVLKLERLIIHEFSHSCQQKIKNSSTAIWLLEGMAGFLAGQYNNDTDEIKTVENGERIAQLVIMPYLSVQFIETDSLDETERGAGGFGSTGK